MMCDDTEGESYTNHDQKILLNINGLIAEAIQFEQIFAYIYFENAIGSLLRLLLLLLKCYMFGNVKWAQHVVCCGIMCLEHWCIFCRSIFNQPTYRIRWLKYICIYVVSIMRKSSPQMWFQIVGPTYAGSYIVDRHRGIVCRAKNQRLWIGRKMMCKWYLCIRRNNLHGELSA